MQRQLPCVELKVPDLNKMKKRKKRAVRFDLMLHAYMMVQSGIPMLYSGDEIGQVNDYTYKMIRKNGLIQVYPQRKI